jgi:signal transduction histidine kinase
LAIAMRYTMIITLRVATVYAVIYLAIIYYLNGFAGYETEIVLRITYLFLIGSAGGFMSQEAMDQIEAKILVKRSKEVIRLRELQLKEAHDKLEERVKERTIELDESNNQLKKINEDLDNFVYSASHDLKSPILNMEALLLMLYETHEPSTEFEKSVREKLEISVGKMKSTIQKLSEVARSQKEVFDDFGEFHIGEILQEVISENEEVIKKCNAQILERFSEHGICCSRTCLKSIVYNLLTNAIKYKHDDRKPEVEFKTERKDEYIVLYVKDNGLGIDLNRNKHKLFNLFKRFHDHVEGAGIGLYTVKRMIEKFGGDIDVESEPGKGSTFKVRFKLPEFASTEN